MKLFSMFLMAIVLSNCSNSTEIEQEKLEEAIEKFNSAFERGDTDMLAGMITDNYIHTNGSWKSFGKEQWLQYMNDRKEKINQGRLSISSYEMTELAIEIHEKTAIVTAKVESSGSEDGVPFDKAFRVTNVWVNHGSQWLRAGFHDTPIN